MLWIKRLRKFLLFLLLISIFFLMLCYRSDISRSEIEETYSTAESHFIDVDGQIIHVRIKGEGEPIVLLHGSFSSLHTWDSWQEMLSPYFLTISIDLPGHGLTGADELKRYSQSDYASLVLRLMEKLNLDKFHLAGNSMGGGVALQIANNRPDQVLTLNLIDSSGAELLSATSLEETDGRREALIFKLLRYPFISKLLLKCTPKFLFQMNLRAVYHDSKKLNNQLVDRYYELMLLEGNREATLDRLNAPRESSVEINRITMPTLIMWGEQDAWIPVSHAKLFEKQIPNSHVVIIKNSGHVPMEESPTETVQEYLSFLGVEIRKDNFNIPKLISYAH